MDGYDYLKNAVVRQAAEDYAAAFMGTGYNGKTPGDVMSECEKFFCSEWYTALTDGKIDGEWLVRNIKIRELEKTIKAYKTILSVCNKSTFKAVINFPSKKGKRTKKPMNYIFPERFVDGIEEVLRTQLKSMNAELNELKAKQN